MPSFPAWHPVVKEFNGTGMKYIENTLFQSWEGSVIHSPILTFFPQSKVGLQNLVRWAGTQQKRLRASGYRHSSSNIYCEDNDILISMLDFGLATNLPAEHPPMNPANDLQGIELVGQPYVINSTPKIQCKFGAATCNYHFQEWVHDPKRGKLEWALPFNVIMTEITFGGSNAPICHGAGVNTKTLSDLVKEIEFINVSGEVQRVNQPEELKAAAGCFGLLGPVISVTLELDQMSYANFYQVGRQPLATAISFPREFKLSSQLAKHLSPTNWALLIDPSAQARALTNFINQCQTNYYAEWFWFPLQEDCWVNCWKNDGDKAKAIRYPDPCDVKWQRVTSYLAHLANVAVGDDNPLVRRIQTQLMGDAAMDALPHHENFVCSIEDALHFRQGIQNIGTLMMEIEIPIPDLPDNSPDWSVALKAWWSVVANVYSEENLHYFPMRTTLEMRIIGGSDILLAPQYGNKHTCSIEVLTPMSVDRKRWEIFLQETLDQWASLRDHQGKYLNIRPHWAKRFENLYINRPIDWKNDVEGFQKFILKQHLNRDKQTISLPIQEYIKHIAYKREIKLFRKQLKNICSQGGYSINDIQRRFSNKFFDDVIFNISGRHLDWSYESLPAYKQLEKEIRKCSGIHLCLFYTKSRVRTAQHLQALLTQLKKKEALVAIEIIANNLNNYSSPLRNKLIHLMQEISLARREKRLAAAPPNRDAYLAPQMSGKK